MTTTQQPIHYGLGRAEGESFEAYKIRRADMKARHANLNRLARSGGSISSRNQLRAEQKGGGTYGRDIMAKFARDRIADGVLLERHNAYVLTKFAQKEARVLEKAKKDLEARNAARD